MSETHRPHFIDRATADGLPEFDPCCADLGHCRDCGRIDHLTTWDGDGQRYCCCCMSGGRRYCNHEKAGQ